MLDTLQLNEFSITLGFLIFYAVLLYIVLQYELDKKRYPMKDKEYYLFYTEIVSLAHGLLAIGLSAYGFMYINIDYTKENQLMEVVTIGNTIAYLINDVFTMIFFPSFDLAMMFHHVFSSSGLFIILFNGTGAGFGVALILYGELSNPFFQARNQMKRLGYGRTYAYHVVFWVYAAVYMCSRGIFANFEMTRISSYTNIPLIFKASMYCGQFLNLAWMILISGVLWKSYPEWFSKPEKVRSQRWWIKGNEAFKKYTKDSPYVYLSCGTIFFVFSLLPFLYAVRCHSADINV